MSAVLMAAPLAAWAAPATGSAATEPDGLWLIGVALGVLVWFGWRSRH